MDAGEILKYLSGDMPEKERKLFEQALESDKALKYKVQLVKELEEDVIDEKTLSFVFKLEKIKRQYKLLCHQDMVYEASEPEVRLLIKEVDTIALLDELVSDLGNVNTDVNNDCPEPVSVPNKLSVQYSLKKILAVAAVACFVFITSVYYFHSSSNERLFSRNYEKFSPNSFKRKGINALDIKEFYTMGKYNEAIQLSLEFPGDVVARFYSGLSYIETKQLDKAIENLQFVVASQDAQYVEYAQWFLGLCYIKVNEPKNALPILRNIPPGSIYYTKTVNLLKTLE